MRAKPMNRILCPSLSALVLALLVACSGGSPSRDFPSAPLPTNSPLPPRTATSLPPTATYTPVPSGPCDNPLMPLVSGNQWQYLATVGEKTFPFLLHAGDREEDANYVIRVQLIDEVHQWGFSDAVICQDGTIDSFLPYFMVMLLADSLDGKMNLYKESGSYAPSYSVLTAAGWDHSWQVKYLNEDYIGIQSPGREITFNMSPRGPISASTLVENKHEPVTVGAGTFPDALVMKVDYSLDGFVATQGYHSASTLMIKTTQWVMPYVGVVRATIDSAKAEVSFGQSAAIEINSLLELMSFTPGK